MKVLQSSGCRVRTLTQWRSLSHCRCEIEEQRGHCRDVQDTGRPHNTPPTAASCSISYSPVGARARVMGGRSPTRCNRPLDTDVPPTTPRSLHIGVMVTILIGPFYDVFMALCVFWEPREAISRVGSSPRGAPSLHLCNFQVRVWL